MIAWQMAYARARGLEKQKNWQGAAAGYRSIIKRGEHDNPKVLFRLGHCLFQMGLLTEAEEFIGRAVHLEPDQASWHYRLGFIKERGKDWDAAQEHYSRALTLAPGNESWMRRLEATETALRQHTLQERVNELIAGKAPTWYLVDVLQGPFENGDLDLTLTVRLADSCLSLDRFEQAAKAYDAAAAMDEGNALRAFAAARCWALAGRREKADQRYAEAIQRDRKLGAKELGVGVFFQQQGLWAEAAVAYAAASEESPANADLRFRCGLALQKVYDWEGSLEYFEAAVRLNPHLAEAFYRLGLSHERMGDLAEAVAAYSLAVTGSASANQYWNYRLGYVLEKMGEFEDACAAYSLSKSPKSGEESSLTTLPRPRKHVQERLERQLHYALRAQSAENCLHLGAQAEHLGHLVIAANAYKAAIARSEAHNSQHYYRLGKVLAATGDHEAACAAFRSMRIFGRPFGVDTQRYLNNKQRRLSMQYLEFSETLPLDFSVVLYESGHGAGAGGNPLQIWRSTVDDPRFASYRHVWVVNRRDAVPTELRDRHNVVIVSRDSDLYLRYLATAGWLINDNTFPPYFSRRDGQKYLNTWHGTPLKTLGRDIRNGLMDHKNAARNFLHATHMLAPNDFTADCLIEKYDVSGIFNGRVAVTGYPRIDATLDVSRRAGLRNRLGIPEEKRVVLYAPTWRGSLANRELDEGRLLADVGRLRSEGWHFLYRGHTMTADRAGSPDLDEVLVPADIDTNDLLSIVDVLVTDYSSIFFDFMATGRPIVYYAYDLEQYRQDRGLYLDMEALPGHLCSSIEATVAAVHEALAAEAECGPAYDAARATYCPMEDGSASARAVEFFFFDEDRWDRPSERTGKTNVLFYQGSFMPNGITTSYLNLTAHLDNSELNVYTALDPEALGSEAKRLEKFEQRPDHVRILARVGQHLVTPEERWVIDRYNSRRNLDAPEMWEIFDRAFEREFRRMFGSARFDAVVCFEGYARFWAALFANNTNPAARKIIYLHNDMVEEWRNRFGYLEAIFRLYNRYDALVSVTQSVGEANVLGLAEQFGLDPQKFTYSNNLVDPHETLIKAEADVDDDIASWVEQGDEVFVTLGRLSPEKGHAKLLRAFRQVVDEHPGVKLLVLGDGPLRGDLEDLVVELNLGNNVLLAGLRLNPFAILKKADCFVFSSDYEGQGLVLLEALILGKPTISTDVVGPRSVLEDGYGLLVQNSIQSLTQGMLDYLNGALPATKVFNAESYNMEALKSFTALI